MAKRAVLLLPVLVLLFLVCPDRGFGAWNWCSFSATNPTFTYDPTSGNNSYETSTITLRCYGGSGTTTVYIEASTTSGGFNPREMAYGANRLNYNIYTSTTYTTIWGNGTSGTGYVTTTSANITLNAYGMITAGQDVPAGTYTDSLTIEITY